ncbi:hypothetical protein HK098_006331 [Nowakowskiella sp. JEL0407]|nr:hypothetical protein HK098_006331 [Nowakowskiella sp. JEL0407]
MIKRAFSLLSSLSPINGAFKSEIPAQKHERHFNGYRSPKIIVIGAGIAGLTVARQLKNLYQNERCVAAGIPQPNIIVLERRDRIGGRIHSYSLTSCDGAKVDLGAQIITGFDDGNPLKVFYQQAKVEPHYSSPPEEAFETSLMLVDNLREKGHMKVAERLFTVAYV